MKKMVLFFYLLISVSISLWDSSDANASLVTFTDLSPFSGNETHLTFQDISANADVTSIGSVSFSNTGTDGSFSGLKAGSDQGPRQFDPVPFSAGMLHNTFSFDQGQIGNSDIFIHFGSTTDLFAIEIRG